MQKHGHNHQHSRGMMIGCMLLIIGVMVLSRVYHEINQIWWLVFIFASHGVMMVMMAKKNRHHDANTNEETE